MALTGAEIQALLDGPATSVDIGPTGVIQASLTVPAGKTLYSTGAVISTPFGAGWAVRTGGDNATITAVSVDATGDNGMVGGESAFLIRHSGATVQDCSVIASGFRYGVGFTASATLSGVKILRNTFHTTGYGILKDNIYTVDLLISGNTFTNVRRGDAIELNVGGETGTVVSDNIISGVYQDGVTNAGLGIGIAGGESYNATTSEITATNATITGNTLTGVEYEAIHLEKTKNCSVTNNHVTMVTSGTNGVGIVCYGVRNSTVSGNTVSNANIGIWDGLGVENSTYVGASDANVYANNTVSDSTIGINSNTAGEATTITINNNTITGCAAGIEHSGAASVAIKDNTVKAAQAPYSVDLRPSYSYNLGSTTRSLIFTGNKVDILDMALTVLNVDGTSSTIVNPTLVTDDEPPEEQSPMARFDLIPASRWAYLSPALRGLSDDLSALESGGSGGGWLPADFCFFGESTTESGEGYPAYAAIAAKGRIWPQSIQSNPGQNSTYLRSVLDTQVISGGQNVVVVLIGANDAQSAVTLATYKANMIDIAERIRAAGKRLIMCSVTPLGNPDHDASARLYNAWLSRYCLEQGVPFVDFYTALSTPAGGWNSALGAGDEIHPNAAGCKAMGDVLVATIDKMLVPAPYVTQPTAGAPNMQTNSLFLTDTNQDGVPDGVWSPDAGISRVLDPAGFYWARATVTGETPIKLNSDEFPVSSGAISVGDTIRFSCLLRSGQTGTVVRRGISVSIIFYTAGYGIAGNYIFPSRNGGLSQQIDGAFLAEAVVPEGTALMMWTMSTGAPVEPGADNGTYDIAKPTLLNVTKLGL